MLKHALRAAKLNAVCFPWRLGARLEIWHGEGPPVQFVIEKEDWAIRWVGERIGGEIEKLASGTFKATPWPQRIAGRVVHFGSQYMWLTWGAHLARNNSYVTSFFHGKPEDGPDIARHISKFLKSVPRLARIVTGAGLVEDRLLAWGVPREKVVRIPIGVDTTLFRPPSDSERTAARLAFAIPKGVVVVGSFQKDGEGWGDGMVPKKIKGPDIFLAVVERLSKEMPVMAFLTGPARGYVKQGLDKLGIPFIHKYVKDQRELVSCYHALDLYLMTSREEGGPMGLMESMSSGVPVVATRVGMAPDLILPGENGGLANPGDPADIADQAMGILQMPPATREVLVTRARSAVHVCDWSVVGRRHLEEVYRPLLDTMR